MPINNGVLAQRYTNSSVRVKGNSARSVSRKSDLTLARENAMNEVYDLAKTKNVNVDDVVTKVLKNSQTELKAFVQSHGETPLTDPTALGVQAVLLRANDIANTAAILDTTDEDALETIEQSEAEDIRLNMPDADKVMTVPVAGAISCALQHLSDVSGLRMGQFIKKFNSTANLIRNARTNNLIDDYGDPSGETDWTGFGDGGDDSDPTQSEATDNSLSQTSIGAGLATIPGTDGAGPISVAGNIPTISAQGQNLPQAGSNTSAGGILNAITGLMGGISQVANSITQAANSSAGAAGAVKNAVSNVGANSIATYVQNNKGTIIMVSVILIILIFAIIYAAKHK